MTADDFVRLLPLERTPAGRFDLVKRAIDAGLITPPQAARLLDFKERPTHLRLVPTPESE